MQMTVTWAQACSPRFEVGLRISNNITKKKHTSKNVIQVVIVVLTIEVKGKGELKVCDGITASISQ